MLWGTPLFRKATSSLTKFRAPPNRRWNSATPRGGASVQGRSACPSSPTPTIHAAEIAFNKYANLMALSQVFPGPGKTRIPARSRSKPKKPPPKPKSRCAKPFLLTEAERRAAEICRRIAGHTSSLAIPSRWVSKIPNIAGGSRDFGHASPSASYSSVAFITLALAATCAAQQTPAPHVAELTAPDGAILKATYFGAAQPGPGILLLHQCNRQRKVWDDLATLLAASGLNVLTLDFRGYGESGGKRLDQASSPQEANQIVKEQWPADVDVAFRYLQSQPGVNRARDRRRRSQLRRESGGASRAASSGSEVISAAVGRLPISLAASSCTTRRTCRSFWQWRMMTPTIRASSRLCSGSTMCRQILQTNSCAIPSVGTAWICSPRTKNCRA